jgi:hypothetical protein
MSLGFFYLLGQMPTRKPRGSHLLQNGVCAAADVGQTLRGSLGDGSGLESQKKEKGQEKSLPQALLPAQWRLSKENL